MAKEYTDKSGAKISENDDGEKMICYRGWSGKETVSTRPTKENEND